MRFARTDRKIDSLGEKLDRITAMMERQWEHQQKINDEHNHRLTDLERALR